jgi:hypothetical protein
MSGLPSPVGCRKAAARCGMSRSLQENGLVGMDRERYSAVGLVEVGPPMNGAPPSWLDASAEGAF